MDKGIRPSRPSSRSLRVRTESIRFFHDFILKVRLKPFPIIRTLGRSGRCQGCIVFLFSVLIPYPRKETPGRRDPADPRRSSIRQLPYPGTILDAKPDTMLGAEQDTIPGAKPDTMLGAEQDTIPGAQPDTVPGAQPDTIPSDCLSIPRRNHPYTYMIAFSERAGTANFRMKKS